MLKIAKGLELPPDFATQTVAILARKRVGKTYTASVIAEECCEQKIPFVVLDPTGAWYGLRSSKDGKTAGYPVIIIGGAHGDIPLEFTAGKLIAEFVVENPGYYVLDLSGSESDAEQDRFATAFAQRLYRLKDKHREPLHLFVDEADSFAPQNPYPGQRVMLGAFEAIVRRGGIRGIGITMITQRSAVLNNNVLMQAEVLIALQTTGPADIAAVDKWIKMNATAEQRNEFLTTVASLGQGEAWIWSPAWLEIFKRVKIRERSTFNSSATPKVGEKKVEPKKLADVDLGKLQERMAETIEKAKAEDPKELNRQIRELKAQVTELEKRPADVADPVEKEVPVFPEETANAIEGFLGEIDVYVEDLGKDLASMLETNSKIIFGRVAAIRDELLVAPSKLPAGLDYVISKPGVFKGAERSVITNPPKSANPLPRNPPPESDITLSGLQRRILIGIAEIEQFGPKNPHRKDLGFFIGSDLTGGDGSKAVKRLLELGLVNCEPGRVELTPAGRSMVPQPAPIASRAELHDRIRSHCNSGLQVRILDALIQSYPEAVHRKTLGPDIGSDLTGGDGSKAAKYLITAGVVRSPRPGFLQASDALFPEGLQ